MIKQYGISSIKSLDSELERHIENIKIKGFSIVKNILSDELLVEIRDSLDKYYKIQEDDFGKNNLIAINELNMLRCPLAYDEVFLGLITNDKILEIVRAVIGSQIILHLQNGIINHPKKEHHQSSWHRDLPYQEYTISKPLGISAFYCIDEFTEKTGGTIVLPYSHKIEKIPSIQFTEENQLKITANPGDVILFDCMVYHKAGYNSSNIIRRGINNVFVAPLLKQQIDLPKFLKGKYNDNELLNMLLGYNYDVATSVKGYRDSKHKKYE